MNLNLNKSYSLRISRRCDRPLVCEAVYELVQS